MGHWLPPQPETPRRQKEKRKSSGNVETAETEDRTAENQSKKKRKQREGEEPEEPKAKKRPKQKHHDSEGAANEDRVAASVAPAPKGKASEKASRPAPAPTQKAAGYDYSKGAVLVPDPMVEYQKQEAAANAKRRAEERRLNPGARSGSPVFYSNVFEGTFRPLPASLSSSKAISGSKTNPTVIDSDPASGSERIAFRGLNSVPTGPRASTQTAPTPTRPKPSIDPATQAKKGKVFTVDVMERIWQKEVDKVTFLNALLDAAGIDSAQREQIQIRVLELGDSLDNAYKAVCYEPSASGGAEKLDCESGSICESVRGLEEVQIARTFHYLQQCYML